MVFGARNWHLSSPVFAGKYYKARRRVTCAAIIAYPLLRHWANMFAQYKSKQVGCTHAEFVRSGDGA
jgi:hypothetical protein